MAAKDSVGKYIYLEHPAEVKFKAYGNSEKEMFTNAIHGLVQIMCERDTVQLIDEKVLQLSANSIKDLLYDILTQIIVLIESENFIVGECSEIIVEKTDKKWNAKIVFHGDNAEFVEFDLGIKSITHHEFEITEENGKFECTVVVDV